MTAPHYHLAGVCGVGMSALAQALLAEGSAVSGSDRYVDGGLELDLVPKLRAAGVKLTPQDGSGLTARTAALVVSTAIEEGNPDLQAARRLDVPVVHRADMLNRLVSGRRCVAVTGTSGKSTVTGMLGWILDQTGADPSVVNGAVVLNWCTEQRVGNTRHGRSDLWVIEADESDRTLLVFEPDWAVITNASADHFPLPEVRDLFDTFSRRVKRGLVSAMHDPRLLESFDPELSATGSRFIYSGRTFDVPLCGRHNAENALCAVALCERMGCDMDAVRKALTMFKGIHRRLEVVGSRAGVTVVDDYAHNPAKIRAAWCALRLNTRRLLGVWRPHGFKPLAMMLPDLVRVFTEVMEPGDQIYILPVYDAGGTADRRVRSDALVDALRAGGVEALLSADGQAAVNAIRRVTVPGDTVLVMGARDPNLPALARSVLAAL